MAAPSWPGPAWGRRLRIAVQLLTRVPVGRPDVAPGDHAAATAFHPLVGVFVAGVGVAVRWAAGAVLDPGAAAVLAVAAMVAVTGALHEDALADAADGLWGGKTADERLRIMRDSRVGAFGAAALALSLLLRVSLLAPLELGAFARAVVAGHVLGRASALVLPRLVAPVDGEATSAAWVAGPVGWAGWAVAAATTALAVGLAAGRWAAVPVAAATVAVLLAVGTARRRLGGVTGDVLGATNQVTHLAAMATVSALAQRGAW